MEHYTSDHIQQALAPRTMRFYPQADSTNDLAAEWLAQGASEGAVVITNEQLKGRGRLGRSWYTPPDTALILSIILRPSIAALPRITMLGAVAISEMLEQIGATDVRIKWPNDVLLAGGKVCGVLPEAVWNGDRLQGVVLGMGINVRIDFSETDLVRKAVSIEPIMNQSLDRVELLTILLKRIDYWSKHLEEETLFDAWKVRLKTLGESVRIEQNGQLIAGVAEAVDSLGALLVRDADGAIQRVLAGDVLFIDEA